MRRNEQFRFGSANLDDGTLAKQCGLHCPSDDSIYIGNAFDGTELFSSGQAGVGIFAGARAGKGAYYLIRWLIDGAYQHHIINMDFKAQNGAVSSQQCFLGRHVINWNPRSVPWMNSVSINPLSMLRRESPTLEADAKVSTQSLMPESGAKNALYFERSAQRITEAVEVTLARIEGVVTLPRLADVLAQIGSTSESWLNVQFEMSESSSPEIRAVSDDLDQWTAGETNSGGWDGIRGEIRKAFACMSDPAIRKALSPPFGFDFSQLVDDRGISYMVNIAEAQEFARTSAPVLKAMYACAAIYKRRNLQARKQLWILDELGNIGSWPFAVELFSYGPSYNIRPVGVFQSLAQMDTLAPGASNVIPNSCGTQIYFGVRAYRDAAYVSKQIGQETLEFDDFAQQERARNARSHAAIDALLGGDDLFHSAITHNHQTAMAAHRSKMARDVRTPDEIMNTPQGQAYVFMPGVLPMPLQVHLKPYWETSALAGRYLDDPFHQPANMVSVTTRRGQESCRVITKPVPVQYAHLPQYADGLWRYVEGYRP